MAPLRIAVAGAGTAGLAAAAFLARDGHDVRLFERFAEPRPIGAGLMLQPTGLACLALLDLDERAIERGCIVSGIDGRTVRGARIFDVSYGDLAPHLFGLGIHRGVLFGLLYDEVRRLSVPIAAATEISHSRPLPGGRVLVDAADKEHGPFDLVVDGTGQRSPLRAGEVRVRVDRPYPYGALWGIVDMPDTWAHTQKLAQVYDGCHLMVGVLPVGRGPDNARPLAALFWSLRVRDHEAWQQAGLADWKARVLAAWPEAAAFVVQIRNLEQMTFASYADVVLQERHADRLVFVGDSGRVTSPQLGQGANMALIDAAMLSACLRDALSVNAALADYAERRRAHTRFYSLASRWLTPFFQSDSRLAALVRDAAFPIAGRVPYVQREMVRTLAGMKTGLFSHLDPGIWHARYALRPLSAAGGPT
ncbi:MAG: FAD-dependent monooxygenase [Hyphomicrobiaceae bacterium]|nr:MAG: FAD-dependent monooxygenase [Hyphomicrobiaceae bacterium]